MSSSIILLAILNYAILASTFTISKIAVSHADPLFLISVRMLCAAPCMFLIYFLSSKHKTKILRSDYKLFFLTGVFHIFIPFIGEFWALQYLSSVKTAITYSLTPFIAAVLSWVIYNIRLTWRQIVGLVLGLMGLLPLFITPDQVDIVLGELFQVSLPELVLLVAVISASYAWFLVRKLLDKNYHISFINSIAMLIGGSMSLLLWLCMTDGTSPVKTNLYDFLFWTGLLILVANIIGYNFYGWLLKYLSINLMSAIGFLCPIFASLYGVVFLGEKLGVNHIIALILVVLGLGLFYRDEFAQAKKKHES